MMETQEPITEEASEQKKSRRGIIAIVAVTIIFVVILALGMKQSAVARPDGEAPDFEMQFFNGYEWEDTANVRLSDFNGRPVVLNFWASWCVECRIEAELLEDTWQAYRDDGVVFLGVAYIDVEPKSMDYLEEYQITYPNGPDLRSSISSKYDITGVPETFFIDPEGKVVHIQLGPVNEQMLTGLIDQMLQNGVQG